MRPDDPSHREALTSAPGDRPTIPPDASPAPPRDDLEGDAIGPYRILARLGEGGFGLVFLAEQEHPVRRRVALKVLKPGMDSRAVIARFEQERQALALMDHPGVARVFDAGQTPLGRPYFVMEHVDGEPVNRFCERKQLDVEARLRLFLQVCHAVHHAHQKGIIHRDLKPANILVAVHDGQPVARVIDFGIAKALQQRLTDRTIFTEHGQLIGTPEYMSPEQAETGAHDIDTRADVYSLAVILYELLTGTLPLDPARLRAAGVSEVQRIIREVEPPRPSTRLDSLGAPGAGGNTPASALSRRLRGDLDWITMKAMDKDRDRRYGSVSELAADIERYLRDEPVLAGPPSAAYRLRKFIRRHRAGVLATAGIVLAGVTGLGATLVAFADTARALARADTEARTADEVNDFLNGMLAAVDPARQGRDVTVREALDAASARIEGAFPDRPAVELRIRKTIGDTYLALGHADLAEPHLERAARLAGEAHGPGSEPMVTAANSLATVYQNAGRIDEAVALFQRAADEGTRVLGPDHPEILATRNNLALATYYAGRHAEAEQLFRRTLDDDLRVLGERDTRTLDCMGNLAAVYQADGRSAEAEPLARRVLALRRELQGPEHPLTLVAINNLGVVLYNLGRHAEAEPFYREGYDLSRKVLGDEHPDTLMSLANLAGLYYTSGRPADAEPVFRQALEARRRVLGVAHPDTLDTAANLARVLTDLDRPAEAEPVIREALGAVAGAGALAPDHPDILMARAVLAQTLLAQHRADDAAPIAREVLDASAASNPSSWRNHLYRALVGRTLAAQGRTDEAERELLAAYEGLRAELPAASRHLLRTAGDIADLYERLGRTADAAAWRVRSRAPGAPPG